MKEYQGEKAIISLTSWRARINTVGKTIYSLIKNCPGFHIVLVLSEEEFPKKEKELPEDLMLFVNNNLIELLWFYENIGPHKKYYPTMLKYRDVPIMIADDDCIYDNCIFNKLYNTYLSNKDKVIYALARGIKFNGNKILPFNTWSSINGNKNPLNFKYPHHIGMGGVLFPPDILKVSENMLPEIRKCLYADDVYINVLEIRNNIKLKWCENDFKKPKPIKNTEKDGLWQKNKNGRNDFYIQLFKNDFLKLL